MSKIFKTFATLMLFGFSFSSLVAQANLAVVPYNADRSNKLEKDWFIFSSQAGDSFSDALLLDNSQGTDIEAELSAKDATITTEGSFTILDDRDQNQGAGNWLKLGVNKVLIPRKSNLKIPFQVEIPKDTKDGEYAAGLAVTTLPQTQDALKVAVRKGVRAYIAVGRDFTLGSKISGLNIVDPGDQDFDQIKKDKSYFGKDNLLLEFEAQNTGNIFGVLDCKYALNFSDGTIFESTFSTAISPQNNALKHYIITNQAYQTGQTKAILDCQTKAQNIDSDKVKLTDQKIAVGDKLDLNQAALDSFEPSQNPAFVDPKAPKDKIDSSKDGYKTQNNSLDRNYLIAGGAVLSLMVAAATIFYFRKRSKPSPSTQPKA